MAWIDTYKKLREQGASEDQINMSREQYFYKEVMPRFRGKGVPPDSVMKQFLETAALDERAVPVDESKIVSSFSDKEAVAPKSVPDDHSALIKKSQEIYINNKMSREEKSPVDKVADAMFKYSGVGPALNFFGITNASPSEAKDPGGLWEAAKQGFMQESGVVKAVRLSDPSSPIRSEPRYEPQGRLQSLAHSLGSFVGDTPLFALPAPAAFAAMEGLGTATNKIRDTEWRPTLQSIASAPQAIYEGAGQLMTDLHDSIAGATGLLSSSAGEKRKLNSVALFPRIYASHPTYAKEVDDLREVTTAAWKGASMGTALSGVGKIVTKYAVAPILKRLTESKLMKDWVEMTGSKTTPEQMRQAIAGMYEGAMDAESKVLSSKAKYAIHEAFHLPAEAAALTAFGVLDPNTSLDTFVQNMMLVGVMHGVGAGKGAVKKAIKVHQAKAREGTEKKWSDYKENSRIDVGLAHQIYNAKVDPEMRIDTSMSVKEVIKRVRLQSDTTVNIGSVIEAVRLDDIARAEGRPSEANNLVQEVRAQINKSLEDFAGAIGVSPKDAREIIKDTKRANQIWRERKAMRKPVADITAHEKELLKKHFGEEYADDVRLNTLAREAIDTMVANQWAQSNRGSYSDGMKAKYERDMVESVNRVHRHLDSKSPKDTMKRMVGYGTELREEIKNGIRASSEYREYERALEIQKTGRYTPEEGANFKKTLHDLIVKEVQESPVIRKAATELIEAHVDYPGNKQKLGRATNALDEAYRISGLDFGTGKNTEVDNTKQADLKVALERVAHVIRTEEVPTVDAEYNRFIANLSDAIHTSEVVENKKSYYNARSLTETDAKVIDTIASGELKGMQTKKELTKQMKMVAEGLDERLMSNEEIDRMSPREWGEVLKKVFVDGEGNFSTEERPSVVRDRLSDYMFQKKLEQQQHVTMKDLAETHGSDINNFLNNDELLSKFFENIATYSADTKIDKNTSLNDANMAEVNKLINEPGKFIDDQIRIWNELSSKEEKHRLLLSLNQFMDNWVAQTATVITEASPEGKILTDMTKRKNMTYAGYGGDLRNRKEKVVGISGNLAKLNSRQKFVLGRLAYCGEKEFFKRAKTDIDYRLPEGEFEQVLKALPEYKKFMSHAYGIGSELGIKMSKMLEDYFPQIYRSRVFDVNSDIHREFIDWAVESGQLNEYMKQHQLGKEELRNAAEKLLKQEQQYLTDKENVYLQEYRHFKNVPDKFLNTDFDNVVDHYIETVAQKYAEWQVYGENYKLLKKQFAKFAVTLPSQGDIGKDQALYIIRKARTMIQMDTGYFRLPAGLEYLGRVGTTYQVLTKMGLSVFGQLNQSVSSVRSTSLRNMLGSVVDIFSKKQYKVQPVSKMEGGKLIDTWETWSPREIYNTCGTAFESMNTILFKDTMAMNNLTKTYFKATGFYYADRASRYIASIAGYTQACRLEKKVNTLLERAKTDWDKVEREKGQDERIRLQIQFLQKAGSKMLERSKKDTESYLLRQFVKNGIDPSRMLGSIDPNGKRRPMGTSSEGKPMYYLTMAEKLKFAREVEMRTNFRNYIDGIPMGFRQSVFGRWLTLFRSYTYHRITKDFKQNVYDEMKNGNLWPLFHQLTTCMVGGVVFEEMRGLAQKVLAYAISGITGTDEETIRRNMPRTALEKLAQGHDKKGFYSTLNAAYDIAQVEGLTAIVEPISQFLNVGIAGGPMQSDYQYWAKAIAQAYGQWSAYPLGHILLRAIPAIGRTYLDGLYTDWVSARKMNIRWGSYGSFHQRMAFKRERERLDKAFKDTDKFLDNLNKAFDTPKFRRELRRVLEQAGDDLY